MWWMLLWCRISAVELARPCKKLVKVKLTSLWPNFWKCVTPSCIGRHQPTPRTSPALRAPDRARPWLWKASQEPWTWLMQPLDNNNKLFLEFTPLICLSEYKHLLLVYLLMTQGKFQVHSFLFTWLFNNNSLSIFLKLNQIQLQQSVLLQWDKIIQLG